MKVSSTLFASLLAMASALAAPRMDDSALVHANTTIRANMTIHENMTIGPSVVTHCNCTTKTPAGRLEKRRRRKHFKPFYFEIHWYTPDGLVYFFTKNARGYQWLWGDPSDEDDPLVCQGNPCYWARIRWACERGRQHFSEGYLAHWQKFPWTEGQKQAIADQAKKDFKEDVIDRILQPA